MESINLVKGYGKVKPSEYPPPPFPTAAEAAAAAAVHKRRLTIILSLTLLLTILVSALVHAYSPAPPKSNQQHRPSPSTSADSLRIFCAVTEHPESCFNSISSIKNLTDPKPDPEKYLHLSLQASFRELTNVSSLPKALISKLNDPGTVSALKDCISLFDDSLSQLNESAALMNVGPGESALTVMKVKDMQTWISAAMTNQDTCLEGLDEMGSPLLGEVKARVQNAKEYMSNTLAILSNMPSLLQKFGITMH
ncbi:pectinesterase 3-like [Capsicum chacoense]